MEASAGALEAELGYKFRDPELLRRALTHTSHAREAGWPEVVSENEQLEFLGDSILGFLTSEWLVARFPEWPEGRLSISKAQLVSAAHLFTAAQSLGLGSYILLGKGEELSGGRVKWRLLANALEALIAAVYLDGGMEEARRLVVSRILAGSEVSRLESDGIVDFKAALGELARHLKLPPPAYSVVGEHGPMHARIFAVEVRVGSQCAGRAEGSSKKRASQNAARMVLEELTAAKGSAG